MKDKKIVHILSHSHWDREWYLPFEQHRMRLVQLFDHLIDLFSNDPSFRSFHLDGQTILLEDYLQVRPERREIVRQLIQEKKLVVGPWYILQDEFLTSSEANVRNLLIGHSDVAAFGGEVSKVGYFPDSFGNMGQAPQLLRQADIAYAVFGRGVKPTGANNMVSDTQAYESPYSEMIWKSPDGSEVIGVLFANWYCNGMEIPVDSEQARAYWEKSLKAAERYASTNQLLFMNGCDHQPVQLDLSSAIAKAQELYPEYEFVHSNFEHYLQSMHAMLPAHLSTVHGELRSQHTDGWGTLVNTASARVYIKQANQVSQTLLEKVAEPLAAAAASLGEAYPQPFMTYAWKTLLQNHPHDSICGCSVDEVHREMMTRFAKVNQVGEELKAQAVAAIASRMNTVGLSEYGDRAYPFAVHNTTDKARSGVVQVEIVVAREALDYDDQAAIYERLAELRVAEGEVRDHLGTLLPFRLEDLGVVFGYDMPQDKFRQPYYARKIRLSLWVGEIPEMGYATFAWYPSASDEQLLPDPEAVQVGDHSMENAYLHVRIAKDGSLDIRDKRNGRQYSGLAYYENVGDIGSEYTFRQPSGDTPITTRGLGAEIRLVEYNENAAVYEIVHELLLPASADERFADELNRHVPITQRKSGRSKRLLPAVIRTVVRLEKNVPITYIRTSFTNQSKDHRLRLLFPTDTMTAVHSADSIYEVAVRDNVPAPEWTNPSNCQHQQAFVNVSDGNGGLTVANKGLNEYEVVNDGRNTIAVTLLRAVAELGDWGVFPTPDAQCLGDHSFECAIIPHASEAGRWDSYTMAYQTQVPWVTTQLPIQEGTLPARFGFLEWHGPGMSLTAYKQSEDGSALIQRWYNMTSEQQTLRVKAEQDSAYYASNILEAELEPLTLDGDEVILTVKPQEIVTLKRVTAN